MQLGAMDPDDEVEFLILDFVDAFWNVPLRCCERKYFVGCARGRFFVFCRAAQGSRYGPLSWAGIVSLLMRCTQGVFSCTSDPANPSVRIELYVDDPAVCIRGSARVRDRLLAKTVIVWAILGFPLAFHKAKRGACVDWIGAALSVGVDCVTVSVTEGKLQELRSSTARFLQSNVVSLNELRSYVGLANHVASVLYVWRPFLAELWAALVSSDTSRTHAPHGFIWTRQIFSALQWISAFLHGLSGSMSLTYRVDAFHNLGLKIRIVGDASPWGIGSFLEVDGNIVSWYADPITSADTARFHLVAGDCRGQQCWEALNLLVALRVWWKIWAQHRVRLEVRSDNVAALTMVAHLKAKSPRLNYIAKELALDLCEASFRPDVCVHTPGVASKIADAISRKFEPGNCFSIPSCLVSVPYCNVLVRDDVYWRLSAPCFHSHAASHMEL